MFGLWRRRGASRVAWCPRIQREERGEGGESDVVSVEALFWMMILRCRDGKGRKVEKEGDAKKYKGEKAKITA